MVCMLWFTVKEENMAKKIIKESQVSCCVNKHTSELEIYIGNMIAATISDADLDFDLAFEVLEELGYEIKSE